MRVYQLAIITYPIGKNETTVKFTRQVVKYLHILIPVGDDVFISDNVIFWKCPQHLELTITYVLSKRVIEAKLRKLLAHSRRSLKVVQGLFRGAVEKLKF